jgi:hypothetical protein
VTTVSFSDTAAGGQAPNPGAVAYACSQLGFKVFPLAPETKRPAMKGGKGAATSDLDQIRDWWAGGEFTGCPVGIATGPGSGVWILDIDVKHGISGFDSFRDLCQANNTPASAFADTITVATPSGGAHLYFRWNDECATEGGVRGSSGHLGPGLDVRGIGGLVKAPGCGGYQIVPRDGERRTLITPAPSWLVKLTKKAPRVERDQVHYEPGSSGARREAARILDRLGRAERGSHNAALNLAAYLFGKTGTLSEDQAWLACQHQLVNMGAGDGMDAWKRSFDSAWSSGQRDGRMHSNGGANDA